MEVLMRNTKFFGVNNLFYFFFSRINFSVLTVREKRLFDLINCYMGNLGYDFENVQCLINEKRNLFKFVSNIYT